MPARRPPAVTPARRSLRLLAALLCLVLLVPAGVPAAAMTARLDGDHRVVPAPAGHATRSREPIVAVDPADPRRVTVVLVTGDRIGRVTIRTSRDGGRTFRDPGGRPAGGGNHPVIAYGPGPAGGSRLYFSGMGSDGGRCCRHLISFSDDHGRTWSRPFVARGTRPYFGGFPDLAVDTDPASPRHGTVYHVYNHPGDRHGPGMRLLASGDFGRSFAEVEVPRLPSLPGYPYVFRIGYRLAPAPDGAVFVAAYAADLARGDPENPFARGGPGNVGRLAFSVTRARFRPAAGRIVLDPPVAALTLGEGAFNLGYAPGLPTGFAEPAWASSLLVTRAGTVLLAAGDAGTIRVARSTDGGRTFTVRRVPPLVVDGERQRAMRPSLVETRQAVALVYRVAGRGPDPVLGMAAAIATPAERRFPAPVLLAVPTTRSGPLRGRYNGLGLRERAAAAGDARIVAAYGDGRDGTTTVRIARIALVPGPEHAAGPPLRRPGFFRPR